MEMEEQEKEEMAEKSPGAIPDNGTNSRRKIMLRWVLLLPVSFFIAVLFHVLFIENITWILQFVGIKPETYAEEIVCGFGLIFIITGALIAPAYKKVVALVFSVAIISMFFLFRDYDRLPMPTGVPTFDGNSQSLTSTKIVATLNASIDRKTNLIWCASFLASWKLMEEDVTKAPPTLMDSPEIAVSLNKAPDPRPYIPEESLYVNAGWNQKGIIDKITKNLAQKFPDKAPPAFPGIAPDSFVAYAYLEANVKFSIPFFQNRMPLVFTDHGGVKTELSSFGIRREDDYAYYELRKLPRILHDTRGDNYSLTECIIDLDHTSTPNQIILALIEPEATLKDTLLTVDNKIKTKDEDEWKDVIVANDVLLVPDMVWRITHRFTELEGQEFINTELKGQRIDVARQDINFRLDRNGAELKSESKQMMLPIATDYIFDRPFLLLMKKRGAEMPYFVMWIENAELLKKWE